MDFRKFKVNLAAVDVCLDQFLAFTGSVTDSMDSFDLQIAWLDVIEFESVTGEVVKGSCVPSLTVAPHCVSGDTIGRLIGGGHNSAVAHPYDLFVLQLLLKLLHAFPIAIDLAGALICRAVTRLYRPEPLRSHTCRCIAVSASLSPLPLALRAL